jgi:hypothetical protein
LSTETHIGTGMNVFTSDAGAVGSIRFLDSPDEVPVREFGIPCVMSTAANEEESG